MRVVVATLFRTLPKLPQFGVVFLGFQVLFAIVFVQMFGGRLGYCLDPAYATGAWQPYELMSDRVVPGYVSSTGRNDYDECMALPKYNLTRFDSLGERLTDKEDWAETYRLFTEFPQWTNPSFGNFDNLGTAMLLLFEVAALEGWPDVMFAVMGADAAQKYVSPYWLTTKQADGKLLTPNGEEEHDTLPWLTAFLFVLWIVLGCFVLLNMVIGVVLDSFNRMQQENEGLAMMTDAQSDWVKAQKEIIAKRPLKKPSPPRQAWRLPYFRLVCSDAFDLVVMAVIVVNTIFMMVDIYEPNSPSTLQSLWRLGFISNCVFFGLYSLEMLLKWMGLGLRQYFKDAWNVFDFSLVIITAVDIAFASMQTELPIPGGVLRVVRLLRVVRVLRLLKRAKQLQTIIATVRVSMPGLRNIGLLMCLLMYIFAIFFTQLYWATNYTPGNFGQTTCTAPNASAAAAEPCDTSFDNKASGAPVAFNADVREALPQNLPCSYFRQVNGEVCAADEAPYYFSSADSNWGESLNRHANFQSLSIAFLTLFRCATGESFNLIMHDLFPPDWGDNMLRCCPTCGPVVDYEGGEPVVLSSCGAGWGASTGVLETLLAVSLFFLYYVLLGYVILNGLFIGVIVDNFTNIGSDNSDVTLRDIEAFRTVWLRYDEKGSFVVSSQNLLAILQQLPQPLGVGDRTRSRADLLALLAELNIPDHGGYIHFNETLTALSQRAFCERLNHERLARRQERGLEDDGVRLQRIEVPVCEATTVVRRKLTRMPVLSKIEKPTHSALTNYLVSLLQSRWRSYAMRRLYEDETADAGHSQEEAVARLLQAHDRLVQSEDRLAALEQQRAHRAMAVPAQRRGEDTIIV